MSYDTEARRADLVASQQVLEEDPIAFGESDGRAIEPAGPSHRQEDPVQRDILIVRAAFDAEYYCATYPDIPAAKIDPLEHFCVFGWQEGRDPAPWFSTRAYLRLHPDIEALGQNPFAHYIAFGESEGRAIEPAGPSHRQEDPVQRDILIVRAAFDAEYYCATYPDIPAAKIDPLEHFCVFGWREGRDPAPWFSVRHYREVYQELEGNPFVHYILYGKDEGRRIWPANFDGPRELEVEASASLVSDPALLDLIRFKSSGTSSRNTSFDPKCLRVHWVIPDFRPGSGGHMTIFRMVRWLETFGHECTIWISNPWHHASASEAYDNILKYFQTVRAPVHFCEDGFLSASGECVVATSWDTVQKVSAATNFAAKFYFVQDFEPSFYPVGSQSLAAELSYQYEDLACICASPWLSKLMRRRYGRWARHFWLAYDRTVYHSAGPEIRGTSVPRIALYARNSTPRRAVDLAILALELLAERGVKFQVDLYGAELNFVRAKFPGTLHGILDAPELASLYRQADIGVCFSATNYSLVPQEMMACGLPVVELDVESTRAIFPEGVVSRAAPAPAAIAEAIHRLIVSPELRREQAHRARAWVQQFSWEKSARIVERALKRRLIETGNKPAITAHGSSRRHRLQRTAPKASICIPTYNGGALLADVVDRINAQRAPWPFEIVIVDSSSQDGSFEKISQMPRVQAFQIPQREFGHGKTRNLAARLSKGEFIAFLTQDAMPADEDWLYNLVSSLEHFPDGAGAFGKHLAWPNASPFTRRDLANHFAGFLNFPIAVSKDTDHLKWSSQDIGWRQVLHFYSDNNSCMRRAIWEKFPYPEVEFGEDQAWANTIIEAGFQKIYAPDATVFHSHDFDPRESEVRSFEEGTFFRKYFNYKVYDDEVPFDTQLEAMNTFDVTWAAKQKVGTAELQRRLADNEARLRGLRRASLAQDLDAPGRPLVYQAASAPRRKRRT
ncbi:rhamnosyltransferase WsaF family glycosyltransferase [Sabulicella rubraurantiaca]|uniref:rhamnosyltransferase WsaF family glycosyltransferase n=1 Tax=Sabulicella rubraurantiaca TaxID=2811429 RepID=UPI001A96A52E|nr:glycosyltransferase [Sabulicella rubraurantiaca]